MLQFFTVSLLLLSAAEVVVPEKKTAHAGRFEPAGPMSQYETTLLSLPVVVALPPKKTVAHGKVKSVIELPFILHRVIKLFVASL